MLSDSLGAIVLPGLRLRRRGAAGVLNATSSRRSFLGKSRGLWHVVAMAGSADAPHQSRPLASRLCSATSRSRTLPIGFVLLGLGCSDGVSFFGGDKPPAAVKVKAEPGAVSV